MIRRVVNTLQKPFSLYFDATVGEPTKLLAGRANQARKTRQQQKRPKFSMIRHIQKQREMVSPNYGGKTEVRSVTERYVSTAYNSPDSNRWMH